MSEVIVSASYEGYESKSINFTEINNIVKERFKKIDEVERKKRADSAPRHWRKRCGNHHGVKSVQNSI
ncbi:hypothetical protein B8A67_09150 [Listeria monocytogenes]|nr:hypothetical protein [Listeria monocytogenes]OSR08768.1 hypothetical protein B8A67_09150 [Listeria monocytogenes]OSR17641.1 hypothetical protein B8A64_10390 [Listeria monocytogenes]HAB6368142.1 hypothetical protein [Listeria monocytogenes]HAC1420806.1 hypothetical protein [Listeria monocytogenes]